MDADLHEIASAFLRRRCGGEEDWRFTVLNALHPKLDGRLRLRHAELPLLSAYFSPESSYAFTSRRIIAVFQGVTTELELCLGLDRTEFGNFKGTGEDFTLPLATVPTATALVTSLQGGRHLKFEYETGRASIAPIYACRFWTGKLEIARRLLAQPAKTSANDA